MYTPGAFEVTDPISIAEIISNHSFATLVAKDGASLFASHLPFLFKPEKGANGTLLSHMAKANRHWQLFNEYEPALAIFNGPHAYISPTFYVANVAVPTWNYVTVHVYGTPRILHTKTEVEAVLNDTIEKHESGRSNPWTPNLPDELKAQLHSAIVAFEIEITRVEAKFKLGQNRSAEDQQKMVGLLRESGDADSMKLADIMDSQLGA